MARRNVEGSLLKANTLDQTRFSVGVLADAAQSLTLKHPQFNSCTPTATRIITLPAVTATDNGKFMILYNAAASGSGFDLTINNAAAATIGTLAPVEGGLVIVVGGAWAVMLVGLNT
jgi:hypothetical protein